jgi:TetR/AcrR family transcriptional repressor of mexJK operon
LSATPMPDRRQMLKDAAIRLACEVGYERTTIKEIARHSGVTVGVIYHYFENKEKLFHEAIQDHLRFPFFQEYIPTVMELPLEEGLVNIAAMMINVLRKRSEIITVISSEAFRNEKIRHIFGDLVTQFRQALCRYFESKMTAGEMVRIDPNLVVSMFFGHFFLSFMHKERCQIANLPEIDEDFIRISVKTMLSGWRQEERK